MGNRKWIILVAVCCLLLGMLSGCGAKSEMTAPQYAGGAMKEDDFFDYAAGGDSMVISSIKLTK